MSKTEEYISKLVELRSENKIDPFNFSLIKFTSWEVSLNARIKEHAENIFPKIKEIISSVLDENVDKEDSKKIAELQLELIEKYSDKLVEMDNQINKRIEDYIELYNEALRRIMESDEEEANDKTKYDKN